MAIKHVTVKAPGNTLAAVADWNANHTIEANTINETHIDWGTGANQVSAVDILIADGGGIIAGLNVETALQENRTAIDLNSAKNTNVTTNLSLGAITATTMIVASSDGADATLIEADTDDAGLLGADKWDEIVANTAAKHAKQHAITTAADHTSTATPAQILKADANGLPVDATNTDAEVSDAVTKKHSQNTDTILGTDCVALDHGAAATDMVINVSYGVGDPPAANTTTIGS
ncbi:unnamed protein product, partial [marine sediment metagenome]